MTATAVVRRPSRVGSDSDITPRKIAAT